VANGEPDRIWIFRKNNGQLRVQPSPVVVSKQRKLLICSVLEEREVAIAKFPEKTIVDLKGQPEFSIAGKSCVEVQVLADPKEYFEYEVWVGKNYADGGSKPGGWVDP
jgi:hypothetical protein